MAKTPRLSKATIATLVIIGVILLVACGGIAYNYLVSGRQPEATGGQETIVVGKERISTTIHSQGTIAPSREATLSTALTGPVLELNVRAGDRVDDQWLIAKIDASEKQAELKTQQAQQAAEQATAANQVENARAALAAFQQNPAGAVTQTTGTDGETEQPQISRATLAQQEAQLRRELDQAQSSLNALIQSAGVANDAIRAAIATSEIRSPFPGVITAVQAKEGQPATAGIVTVGDDSRMIIHATVRETELESLSVGDEVSFTSPSARGKTFSGKIASISSASESAMAGSASKDSALRDSSGGGSKTTFPIEIEVTGDRSGLRLGSTAKVEIITDSVDAIKVPLTALIDEPSGATKVRVLNPDGTTEDVPVKVLLRTEFDAGVEGIDEGTEILLQAGIFDAGN